jgi:hypothetical protein
MLTFEDRAPSMDMIRTLACILGPVIEQTTFILTERQPLGGRTSRKYGFLEYRGTTHDGRIVLLGVYQITAWRTITAEMWVPEDVRRMPPEASIESVALHRRVWTYDLLTDGDALARTIVAEVATWLQPGDLTGPDSEAPSAET